MALFDLRCLNCNHEYQEMVSHAKLEEVKCPKCGSTEKERVYKAHVKGPVRADGGSSGRASGFT